MPIVEKVRDRPFVREVLLVLSQNVKFFIQ